MSFADQVRVRPKMQLADFDSRAQRCDAPRRSGEQSENTLDFNLCNFHSVKPRLRFDTYHRLAYTTVTIIGSELYALSSADERLTVRDRVFEFFHLSPTEQEFCEQEGNRAARTLRRRGEVWSHRLLTKAPKEGL